MNEALQRWREDFTREPDTAFDQLVRGLVPLGGASQLSFGEILDALFDPGDAALDTAAAGWLKKRTLGPVPENTSLHRWVSVLEEYFRGISAMELPQTGEILRRQHKRLRLWLHGFYEGPDRDPEGAYLLALARAQSRAELRAARCPQRAHGTVSQVGRVRHHPGSQAEGARADDQRSASLRVPPPVQR